MSKKLTRKEKREFLLGLYTFPVLMMFILTACNYVTVLGQSDYSLLSMATNAVIGFMFGFTIESYLIVIGATIFVLTKKTKGE